MPAAQRAILLAAIVIAFLILKAYGLVPAAGDEGIYFYSAKRAAEGALPYRDFFFAHPPLHLLPAVVLFWITAFDLALFKLIPVAAACVAGVFLWRAARRELGTVEAIVAVVCFYFAYDLLRASSHFTGINVATAFLAAGMDAILARRDQRAGVLFGCGALTGFYVVPVAAGLLILRVFEDRRAGLRAIAAACLVFAGVSALFVAASGSAYVDQVFLYHLKKPAGEGAFTRTLAAVAYHNSTLLWSAGIALLAGFLERKGWLAAPGDYEAPECWTASRARTLRYGFVGLLAGGVFLTNLAHVFHYYVLIVFPSLALLGGYGYGAIARAGRAAWRARPRWQGPTLAAALLLASAVGAGIVRSAGKAGQPWYPRSVGVVKQYAWHDAPLLPGWLNAAVRRSVWRDERTVGALHPSLLHYLWHESRVFEGAAALVAAVNRLDPAGGPLFGDSSSVPLVALLAGRRIAADEVDTNFMRFESGATSPDALFARLRADPAAVVIVQPGRGCFSLPAFRRWIENNYPLAGRVQDRIHGEYLLYGSFTSPDLNLPTPSS